MIMIMIMIMIIIIVPFSVGERPRTFTCTPEKNLTLGTGTEENNYFCINPTNEYHFHK